MSAQAAIYGRLGSDPVRRQAQSGKDWATGTIAVNLSDDEDAQPQWFNIVAFGRTAETLCKQSKGDLISVAGRLKLNRWRDQSGADREQFQIIADTVISARSVRPGNGRRQGGEWGERS